MRSLICSAFVGLLLALSLHPRGVQAAAVEESALARQRFLRGLELYDAANFADALTEFEASLELFASPNSYLYVARCLRALSRFAQAVSVYERTVALANDRIALDSRYQDTAVAAREELAQVLTRVGHLKVTVVGPAAGAEPQVFHNGRQLPKGALGLWIPVDLGTAVVIAKVDGVARAQSNVNVLAGQKVEATLRMAQLLAAAPDVMNTTRRSRSTWLYTTGASALVGWTAAAAFALLADANYDTLKQRCPQADCLDGQNALVTRGRRYQTVANVSIGVALAATGAFAWLWATGPKLSVTASHDSAGIEWLGRF